MTHILVLGGGEVGSAAVEYAAKLPAVERITVADLSLATAERAAARGVGKAVPLALDVTDAASLVSAMAGKRAVLNTVGPFFRFALPVFRAALEAHVDYLDVADDWEPTLDLLALDAEARAAGISAVIGMGASPGLANLVARAAMDDRPNAVDLITAWRADDVGEGYSAAKEHWLHQCTGTIRILDGGRLVDEPPLARISVEYPGVGQVELVTVGHPEAVTLPRRYPSLAYCANAMVVPPKLMRLLLTVLHESVTDLRATAETLSARYRAMGPDDLGVIEQLPGLFAVARDADGPSSIATVMRYPDGLGPVTASPLAAALGLMLDGAGPAPGVWTPEDAFAPDMFFLAFEQLIGGAGPAWRLDRL